MEGWLVGYKLGISMDRVEEKKIRKKEGARAQNQNNKREEDLSMDRSSAQNIDRCGGSKIMKLITSREAADRSAQNIDRSREDEIMNLRRMKFVFDVAPLEIIDNNNDILFDEDEVFFRGGLDHGAVVAAAAALGVVVNINQINLVIQAVNHDVIYQYWSPKSDQQQQPPLNSSCHGDEHHRDHHHLREDDDDKEMIMITCRPSITPPNTADTVLDRGGDVYASAAAAADDDYIMSLLRQLDLLYEVEWIFKPEQLEEVKRCIIQRINESKPAVLLAKPKTVRIRLDLSTIMKKYYANPAAAAAAYANDQLFSLEVDEELAIHYPAAPSTFYDDYDYKPSRTLLTTALRSSKEALETKIFEEEDLISSSSSSCSVCLDEFCVGVDEIKKMPCSHMFHSNCLLNWLQERNTCPLCYYPLPTFVSRFLEEPYPLPTFASRSQKDQLP